MRFCIIIGIVFGSPAFADPPKSLPLDLDSPFVEFPDGRVKTQYLAGELTKVDHVKRTAVLRSDRTDAQPKAFWDLPQGITMLPYATIHYHGARATLADIPVGTHLHGEFVLGPEGDFEAEKPSFPNQPWRSFESKYSRAGKMCDDFSFYQQQGAVWQIKKIDPEAGKLHVVRIDKDSASQKLGLTGEQTLEIDESTRVWKGREFAEQSDLLTGQNILFNLTWSTMYGPGHCLDIWIDEQSRKTAVTVQNRRYRRHVRYRGVPARVKETQTGDTPGHGTLIVELFDYVDEDLLAEFQEKASVSVAVAERSLRTYDSNDRRGAKILSIKSIDSPPFGHSGVVMELSCEEMLEGFRPGRIVRLRAKGWPSVDLPREEKLWPRNVR